MIRIVAVLLLLIPLAASANMIQQLTSGGTPACTNMIVQGQGSTNTAVLTTGASANSAIVTTCG